MYKLLKTDGKAKRGEFVTRHGIVQTPVFMNVATCGAIKGGISALDLKNQNLVLSALKEIAVQEKKTIILSTHNPNHALFLGSHVVLIKDGMIVESGSASETVTVEKLRKVYGDSICLSSSLDYQEVSFREG